MGSMVSLGSELRVADLGRSATLSVLGSLLFSDLPISV